MDKKIAILIAIVVVLVIGAGAYIYTDKENLQYSLEEEPSYSPSSTPACTETPECTDTDSSSYPTINYGEKGTATIHLMNCPTNYAQESDSCINRNTLREVYCNAQWDESSFLYEEHTCPSGEICMNDACVSSSCNDGNQMNGDGCSSTGEIEYPEYPGYEICAGFYNTIGDDISNNWDKNCAGHNAYKFYCLNTDKQTKSYDLIKPLSFGENLQSCSLSYPLANTYYLRNAMLSGPGGQVVSKAGCVLIDTQDRCWDWNYNLQICHNRKYISPLSEEEFLCGYHGSGAIVYNGVVGAIYYSDTAPFCSDGVKDSTEQCDDGNIISGDGCSNVCVTELPDLIITKAYVYLVTYPGAPYPTWGIRFTVRNIGTLQINENVCVCRAIQGGNRCDSFSVCTNGFPFDINLPVNSEITIEEVNFNSADRQKVDSVFIDPINQISELKDNNNEINTICGNTILDSGEKCDDGNLVNGDGCSDQCLRELHILEYKLIKNVNRDEAISKCDSFLDFSTLYTFLSSNYRIEPPLPLGPSSSLWLIEESGKNIAHIISFRPLDLRHSFTTPTLKESVICPSSDPSAIPLYGADF